MNPTDEAGKTAKPANNPGKNEKPVFEKPIEGCSAERKLFLQRWSLSMKLL